MRTFIISILPLLSVFSFFLALDPKTAAADEFSAQNSGSENWYETQRAQSRSANRERYNTASQAQLQAAIAQEQARLSREADRLNRERRRLARERRRIESYSRCWNTYSYYTPAYCR